MINDLKIVSPRSNNWKYVDDVTISEIVPTREVSILQNELDAIGNWTQGRTLGGGVWGGVPPPQNLQFCIKSRSRKTYEK